MKQRRNTQARARSGFSLVELLVTLLVVTLATIMVTAGLPAAVRAYTDVVDKSNAQVLLTTASTLLRDKLSRSVDVVKDENGKVKSFVDSSTGCTTYIKVDENSHELLMWETSSPTDGDPTGHRKPLIQGIESQSRGWKLVVGCESADAVTYEDGLFTIRGLKVWRAEEDSGSGGGVVAAGPDNPLASFDEFTVRQLIQPQP